MFASVCKIALVFLLLIAGFMVIQVFTVMQTRDALEQADISHTLTPAGQQADVTVVAFVSYGCSYCREAHPTIMDAITKDGRVRYIPRPVTPQDDENASKAAALAYAAGKQGKFIAMHDAIMRDYKELDETAIAALAAQLELDAAQLTNDMTSGDVIKAMTHNRDLYMAWNINGTPTFVINKNILYTPEGRMPTVDDFLKMFDDARAMK